MKRNLKRIQHVKYPQEPENGICETMHERQVRYGDIAREIIRFCAGEELTLGEFEEVLAKAAALVHSETMLKGGYPM